ncbi:flagellar biosynthesis protein FlaG [Paenibacillus sp. LMG 31456]|uniref:Flagellar biosynthesis protein FlaG n=1 Tax=Paenibacillus foliorum TaxID=2654974 RepID=A0A972K0W4_9BACL|nr:flagellar protein FlaG [Paenibacillus foliorum]NOU95091.1 flagellar biosynthesis protein FlaG [Paenibacillus foliorum]
MSLTNGITNTSSGADRIIPASAAPTTIESTTNPIKDSEAAVLTIQSASELKQAQSHGELLPISDENFIKAIDKALKAIQGRNTTFEYLVHKQTQQIVIKVLDKESGELIREIPPEKNLDFISKLMEKAGLFVDQRR